MDTKSKNIKYSYGMKTAALLLAAALVFVGTWSATGLMKILYDFGWENTLVSEKSSFTNSTLFQTEVGTSLQNIWLSQIQNDWQEDMLPNYPTLQEEQERAATILSQLQESVRNEKESRAQNASSSFHDDTSVALYDYPDVTARDLFSFSSFGESSQIYISSSMTQEELAQTIEEIYTEQIAIAQRNFTSEVLRANEALEKMKNFRYLVVNSKTGETLTNFAGIETAEQFFNAFAKEDWFFGYTADGGLVRHSDSASQNLLYQQHNLGVQENLASYFDQNFCAEGYDIYVGVPQELQAGDSFYDAQAIFLENSDNLDALFFLLALSLILTALLSIYLLLTAGHVQAKSGIQLSAMDKLPPDLHFVFSALICGLCGTGLFAILFTPEDLERYTIRGMSLLQFTASLLAALLFLTLLEWILSVVKISKAARPYFKSMWCCRFVAWIVRHIKNLPKFLRRTLITPIQRVFGARMTHIPRKAKALAFLYVCCNGTLFLLLAACLSQSATILSLFAVFAIVAFNLIALAIVWKHLTALDKIIDVSAQAKLGGSVTDIDADQMPAPLSELAKNLSFTQEEMQKAVQDAVRGERMKTELITNVSHDLKTPLTSIISYVDLLKKCDIDDIQAQRYITVLDEKSIRLKRLIDDLVEASKVSSGSITLQLMQVNLHELATQAIVEMEDSFAERQLEIVLNQPEVDPVVLADSQKTWRIIDNLLNNARKYSLAGSRIYVGISKQAQYGVVTVKNISSAPLNIDPDELTQRFVRGDASRTNEGSGLGLSIAKDLCTLQQGELRLEIDGDLFKATVMLPLAQRAANLPANAKPSITERKD